MAMAPGLMGVLLTAFLLYYVSRNSEKRKRSNSAIQLDKVNSRTSNNFSLPPSISKSLFSSFSPSILPPLSSSIGPDHPVKLFYSFLFRYNKTYYDLKEYRFRYQNFLQSMARRRGQLLGDAPFKSRGPAKYGINQFSDLSPAEFRSRYLTLRIPKKFLASKSHRRKYEYLSPEAIKNYLREKHYPMRWDWRDMNVVTPIKNQEDCGACYATSTVAVIETMLSLSSGQLSKGLSVQQILDCKRSASGCSGGNPEDVLDWLNGTNVCHYHNIWNPYYCHWKKHKLATEEIYPNFYRDQVCLRKENRQGTVQIKDYFCKYMISELEILHHVHRYGPVTVAVDSTSWMDYVGGVIRHNCGQNVNHAVVIVGYEVLDDLTPRYIIKNSWGTRFGDQGYVYVRIGTGLCGIRFQVCGAIV